MRKLYLASNTTEKARERRAKEQSMQVKEINWSDIGDDELKQEIFSEAMPISELFKDSIDFLEYYSQAIIKKIAVLNNHQFW